MAYADDDGALSTNNVIGGGVLNGQPQQDGGGLMDSLGNKFGVSGLGNRILGAASALTSGTDPDQSKVLAGLRTDKAANEYSFVTLPNGNVMRVNKNGSYQMLPGNFAKEEDTTGDWNKARIASNSALSDDIDKNAKSSNTALSQIGSLTKLLSGKDAPYQGPGGEAYKAALGVASMIPGINTDNLSKAQTAQAVMNEISLGMRNFAGGMPGSLSDKDLAFLRAMAPSLNNKPEANAQILSMLSKVHERNLDVQRQRDAYAKSHNGMIDDGFRRQIADYAEKNRIFPDMPTSTPSGAPGTTAPIAPGTRPPLSSFNR